MKILEITRSYYPSIGGMEKFVSDRIKIYEYLGFQSQIITTTHSEKRLANEKKLSAVSYLPIYTPYGIVPALPKILSNVEYDILSVNQTNYFYSYQAVKVAKKQNKKVILTPHFYFHTKRFRLIKNFHNRNILPKIFGNVDKIICFTNYEANFWKNNFPETKNKIVVIPHYFKSHEIQRHEKSSEKFFLFIGRGEINKRIDLLIKAFNEVKTDYKLILTIAPDEISPDILAIVKSDKRIKLLDRVPEENKQNLLATCSALILPTDYEAFGIVNLEASFYAKPLLLTELKVFKEILDNRGVLYFKNNVESIVKTLNLFLSMNEEKKKTMGNINFKNLEKYSFQTISAKYAELFDELIYNRD